MKRYSVPLTTLQTTKSSAIYSLLENQKNKNVERKALSG